MGERTADLDYFLEMIHQLESEIHRLILKTNLTEDEKKYILDHIIVVPGAGKNMEQ